MTIDEAIKLAGSKAALARLLGITRGAVSQWKQLPRLRLYQLKDMKSEWFK